MRLQLRVRGLPMCRALALAAGALAGALLGTACAGPPRLRSVAPERTARILARCRSRFPRGRWQVVHSIEFRLPLGRRSALIGVATGDTASDTLRLVALAPEGLTLLDVTSHGSALTVARSVPPFDSRALVAAMVRDVRLMLMPPPGVAAAGLVGPSTEACRYHSVRGELVYVLLRNEGGVEIRRYDRRGRLFRTVRGSTSQSGAFARRVELVAHNGVGYGLTLRLLRATRLDPRPPAAARP